MHAAICDHKTTRVVFTLRFGSEENRSTVFVSKIWGLSGVLRTFQDILMSCQAHCTVQ